MHKTKILIIALLAFALSFAFAANSNYEGTRDPVPASIPFFEGFEAGHTHDVIVSEGWSQITGPEYTAKQWTANRSYTDYNRAPRSGSWNAFLGYTGQSCLLRPFYFEAGQNYSLEFYVRQNTNKVNNAKVQALLGSSPDLASMTQVVIAQSGVTNGVYQQKYGEFSVSESGIYYLGIQGWLNVNPYYISLDDIAVNYATSAPTPAYGPSPTTGTTAIELPSVQLSWYSGASVTAFDLYISTDLDAVSNLDSSCRVATNQSSPLNSYTYSNLDYGQTYYWRVITRNIDGDLCQYPSPIWSFSTRIYKNLPWAEDFTGVADFAMPEGWTVSHENWRVRSNYNYAGGTIPELAFHWDPNTNTTHRAVSPPLLGNAANGYQLSFFSNIESSGTANYKVDISTDAINWTTLWERTNKTAPYREKIIIDIPLEYLGDYFLISWNYTGKPANTYGWYIDNIEVKEIPIITLPWTEDFAGAIGEYLPELWGRDSENWIASGTAVAGGTAPEICFYEYKSGTSTFRAYTMPILGNWEGGYKLTFKHTLVRNGNAAYKVEISTDKTSWSDLWSLTNPQDITGQTVNIDIPLSYVGQKFYLSWTYVGKAANTYGWYVDDVSIMPIYTTPPEAVSLLSPADGAVNIKPELLSFSWQPAATGSVPDSYHVYVSQDSDPVNNYEFHTETTATSLNNAILGWPLALATDYYWTVVPVNNVYGTGAAATPFQFTTSEGENFEALILSGTVNLDTVELNWSTLGGNGLRWDNGEMYDTLGITEGGAFVVASRFESSLLNFYQGKYLNGVSLYAAETATDYTLKIWTGNDGTIAPSTEIYSQPFVVSQVGWQELEIPSIAIPATGSLWIGYVADHALGLHPVGMDIGPAVNGYGNILNLGGAWYSLLDISSLNGNWNIAGILSDVPNQPQITSFSSIPVPQATKGNKGQNTLPQFSTLHKGNSPIQRGFTGYNVYRDNILLTPSPINALQYVDKDLSGGQYTYRVEGIFTDKTVVSNEWIAVVEDILPLSIPFLEDGDSYSLATNYWTASSTNWGFSNEMGNPVPALTFDWSPRKTNYHESLTSFRIDATNQSEVILSYEIGFLNYDPAYENFFGVEVYAGTEWNRIATYSSNMNGGNDWALTAVDHDITGLVAGTEFRVRFVAYGPDSYYFWGWYLDNIAVHPIFADPPEAAILQSPADGSTDMPTNGITFTWQPNTMGSPANYYQLYLGTNPDPADDCDFYIQTTNTSVNTNISGWRLEPDTTYYWTVVAVNELLGEGEPASAFQFKTSSADAISGILLDGWVELDKAHLNWMSYSEGSTLRWDSGEFEGSVGFTGGGVASAVVRFESALLANFQDEYLNAIKLYVSDLGSSYTLKVWTGNDGTITPSTEIYSQPFTVEELGWQSVEIPSIPIPTSGSLWFGYEANHADGQYPIAHDNGPVVHSYGNIMYVQGMWLTLLDLAPNMKYNWNIAGMVSPELSRSGMAVLSAKPVAQESVKKHTLPQIAQKSSDNKMATRSFDGYNVYRDNILLNDTPIFDMQYTDEGLDAGSYSYRVEGIFGSETIVSNEWIADLYHFPEDMPITIGEIPNDVTITITGGSANILAGYSIPAFNNGLYNPLFTAALDFYGSGTWIVSIQSAAPWAAYYQNGQWHSLEAEGGKISFSLSAAKAGQLIVPITLGDQDPTLPVTLSHFAAVMQATNMVKIAWIAESETNHAGYNLYRSEVTELSTALKINSGLISEGDIDGGQISYSYLDSEVYSGNSYYYWLESLELNGQSSYYGPVSVKLIVNDEEQTVPEIPMETKLYSAFPNPFNPNTTLRYSLKEAGEVKLTVYNLKGQLIQSYQRQHDVPGYYQVHWDGRDSSGKPVAAGVYFYRMHSGKYQAVKKMLLSK